jgi:hypothetical protein
MIAGNRSATLDAIRRPSYSLGVGGKDDRQQNTARGSMMTRPSDGEIVAMLGMPMAEMPAAISEIAEMERRAYTLLVEAERLLIASHHRGVAYDAAVVAETLLSVSTDEADAMIRQDGLTPRQRQDAGERIA